MYVPSLTKYVFSSLSTDNAGMPSFLCYTSSHHRWLSDTCTQLVCTCLRTLVMSSADKNSGAVSPDYLCCFYCCNWKRFKETHCIYVTLHHSFSRYLAGGAGWQQHDNKCCVFFARLFWPSHWEPGSSQAAGQSIILFWVFLFNVYSHIWRLFATNIVFGIYKWYVRSLAIRPLLQPTQSKTMYFNQSRY